MSAGARLERVRLRELGKRFGRTQALRSLSLELRAGELTVLLGPNGSGKSTLLALLATLLAPDKGTLDYDGQTQREFARQGRSRIGYVSQEGMLYDDLSGLENLRFFAELHGAPRSRVGLLAERVGLGEAAVRPVRGYSRGMRQRLAIARALLPEPELVLLDEPFTGLDPLAMQELERLLGELRAAGCLVVLSTHGLELSPALCDRVCVLVQGRLRAARAPRPGESLSALYQAELGGTP